MKVILSPRALSDLMDIAGYIAADNPRRAVSFTDEIEVRCRKLGDMPSAGLLFDEEAGVRRVTHARYNIYYRINTDHVRILRILHGARQVGEDDI
ncbi:type II toxin-antitoxin system RelE/ParE family toxin [Asticcacaulis sp.]|uniref:type II toxin-antitoxin system RelE/ParE family toxin n=1 Tax=Asticcacaulis sp. TaxID=1872648 RepID=UPI00261DFCC5|nr:type II toxin-antitoxin system RelE/ParE family toxin [Asticcacaulis sp.]